MLSTILTIFLAASSASAIATPNKRQESSDLVEVFEAAPPIVTSNDVLQAGAPEAIWALTEEQIVSIITENSTDTASGSSLSKRSSTADDCRGQKELGPYPDTNLVQPEQDTAEAFQAKFANVPQSLGKKVPNYYQFPGWSNLQAAGPGANYLGLKYLSSYDIPTCAAICTNTKGCAAFNLYIERDPVYSASYAPGKCSDPPSKAAIKCVLYKVPFDKATNVNMLATNKGQYRASFHVVISASVGYNSGINPGPVDGYCDPIPLRAALNSPAGQYIRLSYYNAGDVGSDASYCASACNAQREYADRHDGPDAPRCRAFVGYTLAKNGGAGGTQLQCAMYVGSQCEQYATNTGEKRGDDTFTVANAYLYNNIADCSSNCNSTPANKGNVAA